jgi:hypothetical protein
MAGTVKLIVPPELPCAAELAGLAAVVGRAGGVPVTDDLVTAGCVAAAEVAGAEVAGAEGVAEDGDEPVVAEAAAEPPEADADAAVAEVDPVPPHAVRPAPPITTAALITTGTRRILML